MNGRILIVENSGKYKAGTILDSVDSVNKSIPRENFIFLNEALNRQDEEKVRKIVREVLKRMFWRIYTRSSFIVQ